MLRAVTSLHVLQAFEMRAPDKTREHERTTREHYYQY